MMCLLCPLIFKVFLGLPLLATKLTIGLGLWKFPHGDFFLTVLMTCGHSVCSGYVEGIIFVWFCFSSCAKEKEEF